MLRGMGKELNGPIFLEIDFLDEPENFSKRFISLRSKFWQFQIDVNNFFENKQESWSGSVEDFGEKINQFAEELIDFYNKSGNPSEKRRVFSWLMYININMFSQLNLKKKVNIENLAD